MFSSLTESALCSLLICSSVWLALKLLRVGNLRVEQLALRTALVASICMPLLRLSFSETPTAALELNGVLSTEAARVVSVRATPLDELAWLVYATTAAILLLRIVAGVLALGWIARISARHSLFEGRSEIYISTRIGAPLAFGRKILVPGEFDQWSELHRAAVLAHEAEHVRNWDFQFRILALIHRAIFWFNPLAWWLPSRLSAIGEQLSDEAAVARVGDSVGYAELLLQLARASGKSHVAIQMARSSSIAERLPKILSPGAGTRKLPASRRVLLVLSIATLSIGVASCSFLVGDIQRPRSGNIPLAEPEYPADARRNKQQGRVVLKLYVLKDGTVRKARVKESSDVAALDEAAAAVARTWILEPGTVNGKPRAMWGEFAISFRLHD